MKRQLRLDLDVCISRLVYTARSEVGARLSSAVRPHRHSDAQRLLDVVHCARTQARARGQRAGRQQSAAATLRAGKSQEAGSRVFT
jgi:hypothetical protein